MANTSATKRLTLFPNGHDALHELRGLPAVQLTFRLHEDQTDQRAYEMESRTRQHPEKGRNMAFVLRS